MIQDNEIKIQQSPYMKILDELESNQVKDRIFSNGIVDFKRFVANLQSNEKKEETKPITYLSHLLLIKLDNPYLSKKEVEKTSNITGLSQTQIRNFFRNQRKRNVSKIMDKFQKDVQGTIEKLTYMMRFLNEVIDGYTIHKTNDLIIEFPLPSE